MCDIDGVVLRGEHIIGNSASMIKQIRAPRKEFNDARIPFTLLTNGGGFIEEAKANYINKVLDLAKDEVSRLDETHIIQCHTPLREPSLVEKYKGKYVLVCGYDEVLKAALSYGYDKAIHVDELAAVYPDAVPLDVPM